MSSRDSTALRGLATRNTYSVAKPQLHYNTNYKIGVNTVYPLQQKSYVDFNKTQRTSCFVADKSNTPQPVFDSKYDNKIGDIVIDNKKMIYFDQHTVRFYLNDRPRELVAAAMDKIVKYAPFNANIDIKDPKEHYFLVFAVTKKEEGDHDGLVYFKDPRYYDYIFNLNSDGSYNDNHRIDALKNPNIDKINAKYRYACLGRFRVKYGRIVTGVTIVRPEFRKDWKMLISHPDIVLTRAFASQVHKGCDDSTLVLDNLTVKTETDRTIISSIVSGLSSSANYPKVEFLSEKDEITSVIIKYDPNTKDGLFAQQMMNIIDPGFCNYIKHKRV